MAGVSSISNQDYSYSEPIVGQANNDALTSTDFLKLLCAQLQYQDMSSPMSNSEMMQQLTQMSTIQSMSTMVSTMTNMNSMSFISYSTSMMGKEVTIAEVDKDGNLTKDTIVGTVTGVSLYNGTPKVCVNGKDYFTSQIMSVGKVEEKPDEEPEEGEGDKDPETKTV